MTKDDSNILDCGQYMIGYKNSIGVLALLEKFFNKDEAKLLYSIGLIDFANGYTYKRDLLNCYQGSILSELFPGLSMGEKAISKFFNTIGRRTGRIEEFEQTLITNGSGYYAIDGHVILSLSD